MRKQSEYNKRHREKHREQHQTEREQRKREGRCVQLGCPNNAEPGFTRCTDHRQRRAASTRKHKYGMTMEEALLAGARTHCEVCGRGPSRGRPFLVVDHNHRTGKVRGILCWGCNIALGHADENPGVLRALADYLERHRAEE